MPSPSVRAPMRELSLGSTHCKSQKGVHEQEEPQATAACQISMFYLSVAWYMAPKATGALYQSE